MRSKLGAVFFDLDGTLVDYEACVRETLDAIWRRLAPLARFGRERFLATYHRVHLADEAAQMDGRMTTRMLLDRRDRFRRVLEELGMPDPRLAASLGDDYEQARREHTRALPGALETMQWVRAQGDLWLSVVTEGSGTNQRSQLQRLGFAQLLDDIVVSHEVGLHKPAPALVRAALARADVPASRAVFVGDRPLWDVAPAKAVGLATALLRSDRYAHELEAASAMPDVIVAGHPALLRWLEGWWAALLTADGSNR